MRNQILLLAFLFLQHVSLAQQCTFSDYNPIKNRTIDLNAEKKFLHEKYKHNCSKIKSDFKEKHVKVLTECYDNVLKSLDENHFYFDDKIQPFLLNIFNEVVSENPELQKENLKLYISKYAEPNAYCDANGIMVFNIGLIRYLENESQIAFVMAHELAHYLKKHNFEQNEKYFKTLYSEQTITAINEIKKDGYDMKSKLSKLLKRIVFGNSNHSRQLETDADTTGYGLLKKTKYNVALAPRVFDILDKCDAEKYTDSIQLEQHFSFDEMEFNESWIEIEEEIMNKKERLTKEEKDSLKTHPECSQRKKQIETLNQTNNIANVKFLKNLRVDSLRVLADFETLYNLFKFDNVGEAFYINLKLIDKFPNNTFLHQTLVELLCKIENKLVEHSLSEILELPNPFDKGDHKIVNNFLNNIQLSEVRKIKMFYCKKAIEQCSSNAKFYTFALEKAEQQQDNETAAWIKTKYQSQFKTTLK